MGAVLAFEQQLESTTCASCGMQFAVPQHWINGLRARKGDLFCPAGHSLHFRGDTEVERLRRELEAKERQLTSAREWSDSLSKDVAKSEARRTALKGVVTRMKNRVGRGVCPCCNRHFRQLARHMQTKHPDFAAREEREG